MEDISQIIFDDEINGLFRSKPVVPPIYQSSNFQFSKVDDLRKAFQDEANECIYTRGNNPTVALVRTKVAALAGADDSLIVSSGVSAISLAVMANVAAGDHVVCIKNPYSWTEKLFRLILNRFGISVSFAEATSTESFLSTVNEKTKVIFLESPNTFTFEILDIKKIADFAKAKNIVTIIDNTYCTPIGQKCIEMGIDIEVHSISKYLNGHSDVIAGAIIGNSEMIDRIYKSEFLNIGTIVSPHDAWLILRGLRTLHIRLAAIGKTTETVLDFLRNEDWVEKVIHPFEQNFNGNELAKSQMKWNGGLFSIEVKSNSIDEVEAFCENLKYFKMAVSWGGHESLIIPACSFYEKDFEGKRRYPMNLIRLYIGLESAEALIDDLKKAASVFK